jgi:hypothetical protein
MKNISILRDSFLATLKEVIPGIENNQDSSLFTFRNGNIYSGNASFITIVPFYDNLNCSVSAIELYKLVSKIRVKNISLEQDDSCLIISYGKSKAKIAFQSDSSFSIISSVLLDVYDWKPLPPHFYDALSSLQINKNLSKLSGMFVDNEKVINTNGSIIKFYYFTAPSVETDLWIQERIINNILKYSGIREYYIKDDWVYLKTDSNVILIFRNLNADNYPKSVVNSFLEKQIHEDNKYCSFVFPSDCMDALQRMELFFSSKDKKKTVNLKIIDKELIFFSERITGSSIEEHIDLDSIEFFNSNIPEAFIIEISRFIEMKPENKKISIFKKTNNDLFFLLVQGEFGTQLCILNTK